MTLKTFVVLSAPSTASSLVAECLSAKISMGGYNNDGHFENSAMLKLTQDILAHAKKNDPRKPLLDGYTAYHSNDPWDNPPSEQAILDCAGFFKERIIKTIEEQEQNAIFCSPIPNCHGYAGNPSKIWGWKDGRIGWTIPIIAPYLTNPHYIILQRDHEQTAQAIVRRMSLVRDPLATIGIDDARILIKTMYKRIFKFMTGLYNGDL